MIYLVGEFVDIRGHFEPYFEIFLKMQLPELSTFLTTAFSSSAGGCR